MTIRVDIDDTIIQSQKNICACCGRINYTNAEPIQSEIDLLNQLYYNGHIILLHTGRGWDCYELTKQQLQNFGVRHHELIMGKPPGIYVDKTECIKSLEELNE